MTKDDVQDFIFLSDSRPVLVRLHIQVDGKSFQTAWEEFIQFVFKYLDATGDGVLSKEEAERTPPPAVFASGSGGFFGGGGGAPAMDQLDSNKDGKVTMEELGNYYRRNGVGPFQVQAGQAQLLPPRVALRGGGQGDTASADAINEALFKLLDTNKDGKLSKEELEVAPTALLKIDTDDDDIVTVQELVPSGDPYGLGGFAVEQLGGPAQPASPVLVPVTSNEPSAELARQLLARYGSKGKQKLTSKDMGLDEATFKQLDANGDGELNADELGRFALRAPDIALTIRLGKKADKEEAVAITKTDGKPCALVSHLQQKDGGVLLDLGTTRLDLRTGGGGGGLRPVPVNSREIYKMQFSAADTDNNGYLDENEAKRSRFFGPLFKLMDRDGDGKLFEKEMLEYLDKVDELQKKATAGCTSLSISDQGKGLFDLLDTNRDGRLSVRELRQAVKLIASLDRDGDGQLAKNEVPRSYQARLVQGPSAAADFGGRVVLAFRGDRGDPPPPQVTRGPVWFRKMDRNRDGDVSRREFLGTEEQFKRIDADGDGLISAEEAEKYDAEVRKDKEK